MGKVSSESNKTEEIANAKNDAEALIQMYQAGFLDGYNRASGKHKIFSQIVDMCKRSFERRFVRKIEKKMLQEKKRNAVQT